MHLIHRTRARGLAEAGDWEGALAEARRAQAALPGDIKLPIELAARMDELGRTECLEEVFRLPYDTLRRTVENFPRSDSHHNSLAWLAAHYGRELDAALKHAKRAVELAPEKPAYLDTLAEVRFRRGEHKEAVRLARRCLELEPANQHFQKQLRRFQAAP